MSLLGNLVGIVFRTIDSIANFLINRANQSDLNEPRFTLSDVRWLIETVSKARVEFDTLFHISKKPSFFTYKQLNSWTEKYNGLYEMNQEVLNNIIDKKKESILRQPTINSLHEIPLRALTGNNETYMYPISHVQKHKIVKF